MVWGEPCIGFMPPQGWVSVPIRIIAGIGQFRNEKSGSFNSPVGARIPIYRGGISESRHASL